MNNLLARIIGVLAVVMVGTFVLILNPIVGILFIICGLVLLLMPNFLKDKVDEEAEGEAPVKQEKKENAGPRRETYRLVNTIDRAVSIDKIGIENLDFEKSREAIAEDNQTGIKIYKYSFEPKNVSVEIIKGSSEIAVIIDGQHVGNIDRLNKEYVKNLIKEDKILSAEAQITGGRFKLLEKPDGELKERFEGYTVKVVLITGDKEISQ